MTSAARQLLQTQRWGALATIGEDGMPYASSVAFAVFDGHILFHLSELAEHTRNLSIRPGISLLVGQPDPGSCEVDDPQTLHRLTLVGGVERVDRESPDFGELAKGYVDRFPEAEMRFSLGDFHLFRFRPIRGNFVGGFGRVEQADQAEIDELLRA